MNDETFSVAEAGSEGGQDEPVPPFPVGFELLEEVDALRGRVDFNSQIESMEKKGSRK